MESNFIDAIGLVFVVMAIMCIMGGVTVWLVYRAVMGRKPLPKKELEDTKKIVQKYRNAIDLTEVETDEILDYVIGKLNKWIEEK